MRLGIDPGITGALALINGHDVVMTWDMPTYEYEAAGKKRRSVDSKALYDVFVEITTMYKPDHIILERQQHNMGTGYDSPLTSFTIGHNYGKIQAVIEIFYGNGYIISHPNSWKTRAGLKKTTKKQAIQFCVENFNTNNFIKLVKHSGRADAVLIAFYGMK